MYTFSVHKAGLQRSEPRGLGMPWWWSAMCHRTFPKCHPADSSSPGREEERLRGEARHKSYVLYKKKYYPCQGKVGCPKMNDNRLIKNNGCLNDK